MPDRMVKLYFGLAVNFASYKVRKFHSYTKELILTVENERNRQISVSAFQRYFQNYFSSRVVPVRVQYVSIPKVDLTPLYEPKCPPPTLYIGIEGMYTHV